ncbi:zinc finger HIT domain-containing protein 3 isoform X2 [Ananas comosus]|uniref:Zinc finger HIT domain-containing protein 3 isoform X2 n=1 Tax=Ananas comosus TaxID=4615 RepID=A0A6P5HJI7_ANACO|nr:zinc finger HIT domain-containing protein 3 isoform X2 [Ananas comosus]XP_020114441.1 zinc finger HIT domain-containing protein 3 isoform X2 [Ananas comosus]
MMGLRKCEVCKEVESKYKCPTCLTPYCSVGCFKKHKDLCQNSLPAPEEESKYFHPAGFLSPTLHNGKVAHPAKSREVEERSRLVSKEQLQSLEIPVDPSRPLEVEEPSWVVNKEQLKSLAGSSEIRDASKDVELRKLIIRIDSSKEPEKELEKAMLGQDFRQYTDKILNIINPRE